jgi:hypothetical protein
MLIHMNFGFPGEPGPSKRKLLPAHLLPAHLRTAFLTPQAKAVVDFLRANTAGISAQDAMLYLSGMTSATLARRICDLEEVGYTVVREKKLNPVTKRSYTRYKLASQG